MKTEVTIDRNDLGEGAVNKVTALPLKYKIIRKAKREETIDDLVLYVIVHTLKVDGELQPSEWYDELPNGVYMEFQRAFCELTPKDDRKPIGLLTNEELKEIRKENTDSEKK